MWPSRNGSTGYWAATDRFAARRMAVTCGLAVSMVQNIWKAHGLAPHRWRSFKLSTDPAFAEKLHDIVGLYVGPPAHAVVLSVDEKSQIQALDRTQPGLPMKKGRRGTMTHARQMAATSARPTLMSPPTMRARKSRCCSHTSSASSAATVSASEDQTAPETSSTSQRWSRPCESSPGWSPNQHELDQSPEVRRQIDSAFH